MAHVQMPSFGKGVPSVFDGSPVKQNNIAGRLKMAGSNIQSSGKDVQKAVASGKAEGARNARQNNSQVINVKA